MPDKAAVEANVYVEDTPKNIKQLQNAECDVIIFENSTNIGVAGDRAKNWREAEEKIRQRLGARAGEPAAPTRDELLEQPPHG